MERRLPTGLSPLDDLLGGGFRYGSVSLIYGEASTGKTTIAFTSLVRHLERDPWAKAYYIDSDNKLSTRRLTQITKDPKALERLLIWRSMSFHEQGRTIESLSDLLHNGNIPIVVDSITGPYRLETGRSERTFRSNKELNRQLGFSQRPLKSKTQQYSSQGRSTASWIETPRRWSLWPRDS